MLKHNRLLIGLLSAATIGILLMLYTTNPDRVGPTGVTVFFGFVYVWSFCAIELLARYITRKKHQRSLRNSSHFVFTATLAGVPTITLALQSLDQLAGRDVIIIIFLAITVIFYWTKR